MYEKWKLGRNGGRNYFEKKSMCRKNWRLNRSRKMINLIRNERWEKGFCEGNKGKKVGMRERESNEPNKNRKKRLKQKLKIIRSK